MPEFGQRLDARRSREVNAERGRRIAVGFSFEGRRFDFDDASKARITGAGTMAGFAVAAGAAVGDLRWHGGEADFVWIAADNDTVPMDAPTCFAFAAAAMAHETAHIFAARALKESASQPADWTDDGRWPA